ncbi:MAG: GDSL-type esterase/lipase family protein [Parvibaculaceae bacterium]|nr:GDSL-type esterase/lipase family protein [Parvibaculaceae bacterium]
MRLCVMFCAALMAAVLSLASPSTIYAAESNPSTEAVPVQQDWWSQRHAAKLQEIRDRGKINLVFIGDSITQDYEFNGGVPQYNFHDVWNRFYGDRKALNLGFGGDGTGHVLWRLENGEISGISPRVAVVLIGTNNTARGGTAEDTLAGIKAVVSTIHARLPKTKVLLLGILPSDLWPQKTQIDQTVNGMLQAYYQGSSYVTFLDISYVFLKNGVIDQSMFMDPHAKPPAGAVHPDAFAQAKMAEAIEPALARLMGDKSKVAQ